MVTFVGFEFCLMFSIKIAYLSILLILFPSDDVKASVLGFCWTWQSHVFLVIRHTVAEILKQPTTHKRPTPQQLSTPRQLGNLQLAWVPLVHQHPVHLCPLPSPVLVRRPSLLKPFSAINIPYRHKHTGRQVCVSINVYVNFPFRLPISNLT